MVAFSDKFNFLHHLFFKDSFLNFYEAHFIKDHKMAILVTRGPVIWMYMVLFSKDESFSKWLFLEKFVDHHVKLTLLFIF